MGPGSHDGRFAPSPTGPLHLGNLRTALLAWLFARAGDGRFLIRVEDLDASRSRPEHEAGQLADLAALGLVSDEPIVRQSERTEIYEDAIDRLDRQGALYRCWCTRAEIREAASAPHGPLPEGAYPGTCRHLSAAERAERERSGRPPALRLDAGAVRIAFTDRLLGRGRTSWTTSWSAATTAHPPTTSRWRSTTTPRRIGEVVRGADLIDTTARQLHVARRLGLREPTYAHVPLMLGPDGARLAKRHGAVTLADRVALGETPLQVRSALAASVGLAEPGEEPTLEQLADADRPAAGRGMTRLRLVRWWLPIGLCAIGLVMLARRGDPQRRHLGGGRRAHHQRRPVGVAPERPAPRRRARGPRARPRGGGPRVLRSARPLARRSPLGPRRRIGFPAVTPLASSADVADLASAARDAGRLGIDTEFMGEGRYQALLCLVQVAVQRGGELMVAVIDPLDDSVDPSPLAAALADPEIELVLHAARQDVALLKRTWNTEVRNIFDTQLAAGFAGLRAQLGYEALISELLGVRLRKSASFTKWDARPLSDEQIDYAREDVLHLLQVTDALQKRLGDRDRLGWAREECRALEAVSDERDVDNVFSRLPRINGLDGKVRAVARELVAWREDTARSADRPASTSSTTRRSSRSRGDAPAIRRPSPRSAA